MLQKIFAAVFMAAVAIADPGYSYTSSENNQILNPVILGYTYEGMQSYDLRSLAQQQHDNMFNNLWDGSTFVNGKPCGNTGKFNVWDWAVVMQSTVDGYVITKNSTMSDQLDKIFKGMEEFYDSSMKAYHVTPDIGNSDIDYDDNAQIASAFITAYDATQNKQYYTRAQDVVSFLLDGWNKNYGGVTWAYNKSYIATISTTESALAALRMYNAGDKQQEYITFAQNCLDFLFQTMWEESDQLFYDGLGTLTTKNTDHFTYHEGTALSLASMLYDMTKNQLFVTYAEKLISVSLNRELGLYNRDYSNYQLRFYKDGANFTQLMIQGLVDYHNLVDPLDLSVTHEIARSVRYLIDFTVADKGYFGDPNASQNSQTTTNNWNHAAGVSDSWTPDLSQYCNGDSSKDVNYQLLYQASMARCLWLPIPIIEIL